MLKGSKKSLTPSREHGTKQRLKATQPLDWRQFYCRQNETTRKLKWNTNRTEQNRAHDKETTTNKYSIKKSFPWIKITHNRCYSSVNKNMTLSSSTSFNLSDNHIVNTNCIMETCFLFVFFLLFVFVFEALQATFSLLYLFDCDILSSRLNPIKSY